MPGGDRTGPQGMGPMTGRAAGYCAGNDVPGYASPGAGRGFGAGRGYGAGRGPGVGRGSWGAGGRGWRNMYYATGLPGWARYGGYAAAPVPPGAYAEPDPEMQKQALKSQADALQVQLDLIKKRLSDIETGGTAE